jgi:hypothetical protein
MEAEKVILQSTLSEISRLSGNPFHHLLNFEIIRTYFAASYKTILRMKYHQENIKTQSVG